MRALRRVLYLHALAWTVLGLALAAAPRSVLTLLDQPEHVDDAWVRVAGIQALGLALLMVPVAHRAEDHWWWCWAFALTSAGIGAVATLNAGFGLPPGAAAWPWWALAVIGWAFAIATAWAMTRAAQERPPV